MTRCNSERDSKVASRRLNPASGSFHERYRIVQIRRQMRISYTRNGFADIRKRGHRVTWGNLGSHPKEPQRRPTDLCREASFFRPVERGLEVFYSGLPIALTFVAETQYGLALGANEPGGTRRVLSRSDIHGGCNSPSMQCSVRKNESVFLTGRR
jgi:hypothetical protein